MRGGIVPEAMRTYAQARPNRVRRVLAGVANTCLLQSGNRPAPPQTFDGLEGFQEYLAAKNYRGALYLDGVTLSCSEGYSNCSVTAAGIDVEDAVGFTPVSSSASWFRKGRGRVSRQVRVAHDGAEIRQTVYFRICRAIDLVNYALTANWAPEAWIRIVYRAWSTGKYEIEFSGSAVPSQDYYIDWTRRGGHDMSSVSATDFEGFVEAGGGFPSPGLPHFTLPSPH